MIPAIKVVPVKLVNIRKKRERCEILDRQPVKSCYRPLPLQSDPKEQGLAEDEEQERWRRTDRRESVRTSPASADPDHSQREGREPEHARPAARREPQPRRLPRAGAGEIRLHRAGRYQAAPWRHRALL